MFSICPGPLAAPSPWLSARDDHVGWLTRNCVIDWLLPANAVPIFDNGCGSFFGVDVSKTTDHPAVYFFDHEHGFKYPSYAAGSSIGTFSATFGGARRRNRGKAPFGMGT
jgi:hypothetical protein